MKIPAGYYIKKFFDANICNKADPYLSGHDHNLQILPGPAGCEKTLFVVSGAAASTTKFKGNGPTYFQARQLGFTYIIIKNNSATIKVINENGKELFSQIFIKR